MISDFAAFKFQWYKKRFDSELKRKVYGQRTFDPQEWESNVDRLRIIDELTNKLKQKTEQAM